MKELVKITTPEQLVEILEKISNVKNTSPRIEDLRFVLYARKSTDEASKQIYSLEDQIAECERFAVENNLRVVERIKESESAKEPDIRPRFRQMIDGLKAAKYDAILAWHPDRLARNMKDAGEIIDLLDKGIIKDLKFKSFTFENNTSGKMVLGITFVLSKQYSDHLSDSVTRGNKQRILEGRHINRPKHGYIKDAHQYLIPDGENFQIIKSVFTMRLEGKTMDEIAEIVSKRGYTRLRKSGKRFYPIVKKQFIKKILQDPVYTGVMWYGKKKPINLMALYNFTPMTTVEEFMEINHLSSSGFKKLAERHMRSNVIKADLLRDMVVCAECGEDMTAGITPKKNSRGEVKRYFYLRCDTDDCSMRGKSVRAKILIDYVCDYLDKKPFSSKEAYDHFTAEMENVARRRLSEAKSIIFSLEAQKRADENKFANIKDLLLGDIDQSVKKEYSDDLREVKERIAETDKEIKRLRDKLAKGKTSPVAYSEFIELIEKVPQILRTAENMSSIDFLIKKIFLNFTVKNKKVINSTLKSPFDSLETYNVPSSGR